MERRSNPWRDKAEEVLRRKPLTLDDVVYAQSCATLALVDAVEALVREVREKR
jgi:hypothetical protein